MSSPGPEAMLNVLKIILSEEKAVVIQQWQGDALDNEERGRLRRLSHRFPPVSQESSGVGEVANSLNDVFLHSVNVGHKRKAASEISSDEEEDEVEGEDEEEHPKQDTTSSYGPRKTRSQSSTNQSSKTALSNDATTPTTPRKIPRTGMSATPTSQRRKISCPTTPSAGTKSSSMVPMHNGLYTWAAIRKLPMLQLHKSIAMHLEDNKEGDPALFLNDKGSLLLFQPKTAGVRSIQEGFAAILLYHNQMEHRCMLDRVRTLFMWLFFGDFAAAVYGENCRITKAKARVIVDALETRLKSRSKMDKKQQEEVETSIIDQIPDLHIKGKRLAHLCERFGTGTLFWLAEHLTPHFVANRITLDGGPYNEAIHKLQALGLKEKAESSGANRLGDRTRKVLAEEFGAGDENDGASRIVVA